MEPERLAGWLRRFASRHGAPSCSAGASGLVLRAPDGTEGECQVPFPPMAIDDGLPYAGLIAHALRDRRVGVLLVRSGGYAAGVFVGRRLVTSKVGSRNVHGRNAAGGWSQQRYARRREGQLRVALQAAAHVAAHVLLPVAGELDAVVLGGDRRAVAQVLEDSRLRDLRRLVTEPHLEVRDPKLRVLEHVADRFRAVRIRVVEPPATRHHSATPPEDGMAR